MTGSPGCWGAFGEVLAREYQSPALFAACHRLTVDAYAVQHPGDPDDRRASQSVWLHYRSLRAVIQDGASHEAATALLKSLAGHPAPSMLLRPAGWRLTVADVVNAADHVTAVSRWAEAALAGWRPILG
jgi:hypothetical protein